MGQIAFWSGRHGQTGITSNVVAVSAIIGTEYVTKTLVSHTHWSMSSLEAIFLKKRKETFSEFDYSRKGLDSLELLARSEKLEPASVKDYTDTILKDRLELLRGTSKPSEELHNNIQDVIQSIYAAAKNYYDLLMIDVNSGTRNKITQAVLETSDLIVVCLNQNLVVLDEFFNNPPSFLKDKKYVIVLGQYEPKSKYKISNLIRIYKPAVPIYTVPHNAGFMDAMNDKAVLEFILRNQKIGKDHENYYFMSEVRRFAKGIFDAVGMDTKLYSVKGA